MNQIQKKQFSLSSFPMLLLLVCCFFTSALSAQSSRFYPKKTDYYTISLNGKNMSVKGTAKAEANIELAAPNGSSNQQFRIIEQLNNGKSTNYYLIESKAKQGLYLTIHYSRLKEGTNIKLNPRKNNNQLWAFKDNAIETKLNINRFIGTKGSNNLVIVHKSQRFTFTKVSGSTTPITPPPTASTKKVTAGKLMAVDYSKGGKPSGSFENIGGKRWGEFKKGSSTVLHIFEETGRGKFSVFLIDRKRNIKVALNLHTKKVIIGNNPHYDITKAYDEPVLSGYNVGKVNVQGQSYMKVFDNEWHRTSSTGIENVYVEQSRNRNEVQLISKYGKTIRKVKIDVKNNKVISNTSGAAFSNGNFTEAIKEIKVRPAVLPGAPPSKLLSGKTVGEKCYILTSVENRSKVIDIVASGKADGTKVNFWGRKKGGNQLNQLFWFSPVSAYEFMMVPHHKIDKLHGNPNDVSSRSHGAISFSKKNPAQVSIKAGRKADGSESKPNSNLSIQLFEVDNGALNTNEIHVAIKTKKGYFTYNQGQLTITKKYQGTSSTFVFEKTNEQGAPLGLFSQQYAAPVPIAPLTAAQIRNLYTVIMEDGKLENYKGTKIWVRKDKSGTTIDVLRETSRKNGKIYLKTENNMADNFPLSRKITDLIITSNYVLNHNSIIVDFVKSTNSNALTWATGYGHLNILKFRGMVVMMYATKEATFTDGCSAGAPREKEIFRKACDSHDDNWAAPWRLAGYSDEVGQKLSDAIFLKDMKALAGNGWDREVAAGAFFRAVRSTDEAQNNFKQSRTKESARHVLLYKPTKETRDAFTNIVNTEYADDALDDVVNFIGDVKTFFAEDFVGFFEDIF